jgi:acyl carrier protein
VAVYAADWARYRVSGMSPTSSLLKDLIGSEDDAPLHSAAEGLEPEGSAGASGPPREAIEAWLTTLVAKAVGVPPSTLSAETELDSLELDSILMMEIVARAQDRYGVRLSRIEELSGLTIGALAGRVEEAVRGSQARGVIGSEQINS